MSEICLINPKAIACKLLLSLLFICALCVTAAPIYLRNGNELMIIDGDVLTIDNQKYDLTKYPKREKLIKLINQQKISTAMDLIRKFPPENSDDLNTPNADGITPLMLAAKSGNLEEIKRVIGFGNEFLCDKDGKNAAIYAIENGQTKALSLLGQSHCNVYALAYVTQMSNWSSAFTTICIALSDESSVKSRRPDKDSPEKLWGNKYNSKDVLFLQESLVEMAVLFASDDICTSILKYKASNENRNKAPYENPVDKVAYNWKYHYDSATDLENCSLLGLVLYAVKRKGTMAFQRYNALPFRQDLDKRCALLYSLGLRLNPDELAILDQAEKEKYQALQKLMDTIHVPVFAAGHTDYYKYSLELNKPARVCSVLKQGHVYPGASQEEALLDDLSSTIKKNNYEMAKAFYDAIYCKDKYFWDYLNEFIQYADENETMKLMPRLVNKIHEIQLKEKQEQQLAKKQEQLDRQNPTLDNAVSNVAFALMDSAIEEQRRNNEKSLEMQLYKKSNKIDTTPITPITYCHTKSIPNCQLELAALHKRFKVIDELLKAGVKLENSDALAIASSNNYCDVISHFAKCNAIVKKSYSARDALVMAQPEAEALLRKLGVK